MHLRKRLLMLLLVLLDLMLELLDDALLLVVQLRGVLGVEVQ